MAGRACHVVGSATHVGLTQVLGASNLELKRFSVSVTSGGPSTPIVAGLGPPASVTFWEAHSRAAQLPSYAQVMALGTWHWVHCEPEGTGAENTTVLVSESGQCR